MSATGRRGKDGPFYCTRCEERTVNRQYHTNMATKETFAIGECANCKLMIILIDTTEPRNVGKTKG